MDSSAYEKYFDSRGVNASYYDGYSLPRYMVPLLGQDKSINILDFGCGFGQNILAIKKLGFSNIQGFDIEPAAIDFCKTSGIDIFDGRLQPIDKLPEGFDIVIATHILEHIPKHEIIGTLKSLRRILKEGGFIFISVPNAQSNTGCYWMYEDFTHHTIFTAGSLLYVLRQSGFADLQLHDRDCLIGGARWKNAVRQAFLFIYRANNRFWNKVTSSSYHAPSPIVNSYEIKMIARK